MTTPDELRERRRTEKLTQAGMAAKLGVTPHTVAVWEQGKQPIPHWVSMIFEHAEKAARQTQEIQARLETRIEEVRKLHAKVAEFAPLAKEATKLRRENEALQRKLNEGFADVFSGLFGKSKAGAASKGDAVYKRLARKYHPDRNPQHAEMMKDINELYQSTQR